MGYFSHIILALATVIAADAGLSTGWSIPWAVVLLVPIPHLLAGWIRGRSLRGKFRIVATGTRVLTFVPVLLQGVAVSVFGWAELSSSWLGEKSASNEMPELAILFALVPFVLFEFIAIDARSRLFATLAHDIARLRNFQYRMFLSGLVPIVIYMALAGVLAFAPGMRAVIEEVELFHALFALVSLSIFGLALPAILRNTWETAPLTEGVAFSVLNDVARRAGFHCKRLLVWKTGHQVSNAAILGFHERQRTVLFSDQLLAELEPRELAAVFAHEIGHARRKHVPIFAAWTLAFFLLADFVVSVFGSQDEWIWITQAAALVLAWYLGFGYLSRRFELDADLESLAITEDGEALISALENVGGVHARNRPSWRHFSTAKRVLFLRAQMRDPGVGQRLRANLRRWTRAGVVLLCVALVLELAAMGSNWNENWVAADLRTGRYDEALARVEEHEVDGELGELVRLAASAAGPDGRLTGAELNGLALDALRESDALAAVTWLELAARRGLSPAIQVYPELREGFARAEDEGQAELAMRRAIDGLEAAE